VLLFALLAVSSATSLDALKRRLRTELQQHVVDAKDHTHTASKAFLNCAVALPTRAEWQAATPSVIRGRGSSNPELVLVDNLLNDFAGNQDITHAAAVWDQILVWKVRLGANGLATTERRQAILDLSSCIFEWMQPHLQAAWQANPSLFLGNLANNHARVVLRAHAATANIFARANTVGDLPNNVLNIQAITYAGAGRVTAQVDAGEDWSASPLRVIVQDPANVNHPLISFLPWAEGTCTYTTVDGNANVFMTGPLEGCWIFVATAAGQPPLVIHANSNNIGDPAQSATAKNNCAATILALPAFAAYGHGVRLITPYLYPAFVYGIQAPAGTWTFSGVQFDALAAGNPGVAVLGNWP